jgi:hypothetical protein
VTANPKRARLFHNKAFANEDIYRPFLKSVPYLPVLEPLNKELSCDIFSQLLFEDSRLFAVLVAIDTVCTDCSMMEWPGYCKRKIGSFKRRVARSSHW